MNEIAAIEKRINIRVTFIEEKPSQYQEIVVRRRLVCGKSRSSKCEIIRKMILVLSVKCLYGLSALLIIVMK